MATPTRLKAKFFTYGLLLAFSIVFLTNKFLSSPNRLTCYDAHKYTFYMANQGYTFFGTAITSSPLQSMALHINLTTRSFKIVHIYDNGKHKIPLACVATSGTDWTFPTE